MSGAHEGRRPEEASNYYSYTYALYYYALGRLAPYKARCSTPTPVHAKYI